MVKRAAVGQRQTRVQVISFTNTKNSVSEDVDVEVSQGFFFAKMEDVSGRETDEGKVIHIIDRTYTIPYDGTIKATGEQMVLKDVDENKTYQIYYVQELGRKEQLLLKCRKRD